MSLCMNQIFKMNTTSRAEVAVPTGLDHSTGTETRVMEMAAAKMATGGSTSGPETRVA